MMKSHKITGGGSVQLHQPALITHGADDAVVGSAAADQHKAGIAKAQIEMMRNAGRACFWNDPAAFNRRLRTFAEGLA